MILKLISYNLWNNLDFLIFCKTSSFIASDLSSSAVSELIIQWNLASLFIFMLICLILKYVPNCWQNIPRNIQNATIKTYIKYQILFERKIAHLKSICQLSMDLQTPQLKFLCIRGSLGSRDPILPKYSNQSH